MNELQRQAYLDAMGVDAYFPRLQLAGALASTQCQMPAPIVADPERLDLVSDIPSAPIPSQTQGNTGGRPALVSELLDIPSSPKTNDNLRPARAKVSTADCPTFALAVTVIQGSLLVVDECPADLVQHPNYQSLLQNIVFALGLGRHSIVSQPFQWPMVSGGQADQSEPIARQTLQAYLQRQLELGGMKHVLLMGEAAGCYAADQQLEEAVLIDHDQWPVRLLSTLSASLMLSQPGLKRQLWQHLQPLRQAFSDS